MELTYKQLERTLMVHFRIHPDREGTFRSRIKQLQRMEFPPGANVGRGTKMVYNAAHLFQLVTAFELIGAGLTADRVVNSAAGIVPLAFPTISYGFGIVAALDMKLRPANKIYAVLEYHGLSDLQWNDNEPAMIRYAVADSAHLEGVLFNRPGGTGGSAFHVLNLTSIYRSVVSAAATAKVGGAQLKEPEVVAWLGTEDLFRSNDEPPAWLHVGFNPYRYDESLRAQSEAARQRIDRIGAAFREADAERYLTELTPDPATGYKRAIARVPGKRLFLLESSAVPLMDIDPRDGATLSSLIREHVVRISSPSYREEIGVPVEYSVAYIPGKTILESAGAADPDIVAWALQRRVLLAPPNYLGSLAKAVTAAWANRADEQAKASLPPTLRDFFQGLGGQPASSSPEVGAPDGKATADAGSAAEYFKPVPNVRDLRRGSKADGDD